MASTHFISQLYVQLALKCLRCLCLIHGAGFSTLCRWDQIDPADLLPFSPVCCHLFFTSLLLTLILRFLLLGNKMVQFQFNLVEIAQIVLCCRTIQRFLRVEAVVYDLVLFNRSGAPDQHMAVNVAFFHLQFSITYLHVLYMNYITKCSCFLDLASSSWLDPSPSINFNCILKFIVQEKTEKSLVSWNDDKVKFYMLILLEKRTMCTPTSQVFYRSKMSKIFVLSNNPGAICPFVSVGQVKATLFCYIYTNFAMLEHAIQIKFLYLLDVRYQICTYLY